MNARSKKVLLTGVVAAVAAIFAEHLLKPNMKKKLRI